MLSNHDVVRHASRLVLPPGTDENAWLLAGGRAPAIDLDRGLRRARAATLLMLALPGPSYVYQGEELGLPEVADLPVEVLQDPIWEQTGRVRKGRDGCRVPLPWTTTGPSSLRGGRCLAAAVGKKGKSGHGGAMKPRKVQPARPRKPRA
ncbi:hypothetical protein SALBM311S_01223 [Streptomyces alboniger]